MPELKNVVVDAISLVKSGANGEPIKIYKAADTPEVSESTHVENVNKAGSGATPEVPAAVPTETPPENASIEEESIAKSTRNILKELFAPIIKAFAPEVPPVESVNKSTDIDNVVDWTSFISRITDPETKIVDAFSALRWSIDSIFWDNRIDDGKERILKNIDDFKAYVAAVLDSPREIQAAFFEKGEKDMTASEMTTMLKEALEPVNQTLTGLSDKVSNLEKSAEPTVETTPEAEATTEVAAKAEEETPATQTVEKTGEDLVNLFKSTLTEGLAPINKAVGDISTRLDTLENMRGLSKGIAPGAESVAKGAVDEWPEINFKF